jgi:hypothetical protein
VGWLAVSVADAGGFPSNAFRAGIFASLMPLTGIILSARKPTPILLSPLLV